VAVECVDPFGQLVSLGSPGHYTLVSTGSVGSRYPSPACASVWQ
jgi:hypothetical protein